VAGRGGEAGRALCAAYAGRARAALARADAASAGLDPRGLRAPRLMRVLYAGLLDLMEDDGFRVFERRYRLGAGRKAWIVAKALLA
ncbi:MAG TPA: squalene/phytoene synthase family protein, partial [bacterium]|nr:squalene/phytoene synthase family protein [bacterium]